MLPLEGPAGKGATAVAPFPLPQPATRRIARARRAPFSLGGAGVGADVVEAVRTEAPPRLDSRRPPITSLVKTLPIIL